MNPIATVTTLSRAGLSLREITRLRPEDIRTGPVVLPGSENSRALTPDEAGRVLAAVDGSRSLRDRVAVRLALYVGARQIELRRLTASDIRRRPGGMFATLTGKGRRRRTVWLPGDLGFLCGMLSSQTAADQNLFRCRNGAMSKVLMWRMLRHYLNEAGVNASPHSLRHTSATWLLNTGASLEEAMEILGHSEASSHEVYAAAGNGWFLQQWKQYHPLALGDEQPLAHIYVAGDPYQRRMARGVERVVPIPLSVTSTIELPLPPYKSIIRAFARKSDTNPSELRERTAAQMAEAGAHPFFLSLLLGVTPEHVVNSKWDRKGEAAHKARAHALERVADMANRGSVV